MNGDGQDMNQLAQWREASQINAQAVSDVVRALMSKENLPFLSDLPPWRKQRILDKLNVVTAYPTPLGISMVENEIIMECAVGGKRVHLLLEVLKTLSPNATTSPKPGLYQRAKSMFSRSKNGDEYSR